MAAADFSMTEEQMALWEEQIIFWRDHLDIAIEDMFPPVKLTRIQHVLARAIGQCSEIREVCSRGLGKTFLGMLCMAAIAVLYPGADQITTSNTVLQATLMFEKLRQLADQNPNVANELRATSNKNLITLSKTDAKCIWKSSTVCRALPLESARGQRAKVLWQDESLEVDADQYNEIAEPIKNTTRLTAATYGFKDFESKSICMTSACDKSNSFYKQFMYTLKEMAKGDKSYFACALDYRCAIDNGITDAEFFEKERRRMPESAFMQEYGTIFLGANADSAFPYELVESCRTLKKIEMEQPKNSKSRYVIGLDIATSAAEGSDNSIISVIKFVEKSDGTFTRKLVNMRAYNGKSLDFLAEEIRKMYHLRFPNAEKIVYDARGVGDSFDKFMEREWVDPATGREYPPMVCDDVPSPNPAALTTLRPFRAVQALNQRIYTNLRVVLEKHTIELPVSSRIMQMEEAERIAAKGDDAKVMTMQEKDVYLQTDALQFEMGNVVIKIGASGGAIIDVPKASMHKDRYSSLAMANDYVSQIEEENVKRMRHNVDCIGIVDTL